MVNKVNAVIEQFNTNQCATKCNAKQSAPYYLLNDQATDSVNFKGGNEKKQNNLLTYAALGGLAGGFFLGSKWGPFRRTKPEEITLPFYPKQDV